MRCTSRLFAFVVVFITFFSAGCTATATSATMNATVVNQGPPTAPATKRGFGNLSNSSGANATNPTYNRVNAQSGGSSL